MNELHKKIISYFKNNENPIILELGTFDLSDSIEFSKLLPTSTIYAFECSPDNIDAIKHLNYPTNIHIEHSAIGNIDGEVDFYPSKTIDFQRTWFQSGSTKAPYKHLEEYTVSFSQPVKVEGIKLDTWYKNSGLWGKTIELIYSDLNGSDGDMIDGGMECLKNTRLLYLELFDKELYKGMQLKDEINKKLTKLGFDFCFEHGHNALYGR